MTDPCERWMELSDRQLVGEDLSDIELELVRAHELDCEQCAREAAVFRELRTAPLHLVPSEDDVQRILLQAELSEGEEDELPTLKHEQRILLQAALSEGEGDQLPTLKHERPPSRISTAAVAALASALALAACFWLYVRVAGNHHAASVAATAALDSNSGSPAPASELAHPPTQTLFARPITEDTCASVVEGIVVCLVAGSEVGEIHGEGPRRTVELKRGRAVASLKPQAPGTSFSITTAAGKVTAVGTIFSVEIGRDSDVYASVTRGKVLVEAQGGVAAVSLTAGQMVRLGESEVSAQSASQAQQDLDLVANWAAALTDTRGEGQTAFDRADGSGPDSRTGATPRTLKDELGLARNLRMQGQFARAAKLYRSIYSRSPRSEGGRAALLSLASLQLSALGDAKGALASYEKYLAGGHGPLSQQAEYGRIRALHQLGVSAAERDATRKFIAHYPNAPETRLLQERDSVPSRR